MTESKYSLLLLEPNKTNKEDDSEYDMKFYKKNTKYKINNFEKFKQRIKINNADNEQELKGAENQVKSLLSNFIRNFQSENNNSDIVYKPFDSFKNTNDIEINSNKRKGIKKIRTITYKNYISKKSNKNQHSLIGNKNDESNHPIRSTPKPIFSHKNLNKVHFSVSPRHKRKKIDSQKYGNFTNFKYNNHYIINNENIPPINTFSFEAMNNTSNKANKFFSGKNIKTFGKNTNSVKNNGLNIKTLIKKTQTQNKNYLNFKNDEFISNNTNSSKEKITKKFASFKNFVNNIKNNLKQINKNKVAQNNNQNNEIIKKKLNRMLTETNPQSNLMFSSNKVQRCLSPKSKKSSLFRRQQMQILGEKNEIKSESQKTELSIKGTNDINKNPSIKKVKRSETSKFNTNKNTQDEDKIKFLKLISDFKTIKQRIRKSIILRPEDQEESKKERKESFRKKCSKKKQLTSDKIINLKKMISDESPEAKKDVERSNTIVYKGDKNEGSEVRTKEEKNENNLEKEISPTIEMQQTQKTDSYQEQYSFHSIKRKSVIHFEKYRMLTHKGVIYDSLDDEELEDEEDINRFYIDPNSYFCFIFDLILFIISLITFFEIPLYLAMNLNFCKLQRFSINDTLNLINELMNVLDFFFGFFRGFYNWEEQLVKKNTLIVKRYLWGWFLLDLISAIPVYTITKIYEPICDDTYITAYYNSTLDNIYYLFLCNRLLKMLKIFSDNQAWKYISNKLNDFWSLIFSICLILLGLNYTGCLYIFIARNSYPNWILKARLDISDFRHIYICSIYILLMALTTVGYGDITCCSFPERIFQVFLLIIGIMAYSWLVSSFSNFIKKINEKSVDFEKKKYILDEIKINNPNLPDDLYDNILRYLKFRHFHEKNIKNIIFDCLPVGLKNNLIYEMYKPIIKNFIFFKNFQNTDFIVQVILSFKPIIAYKNYILVNEGELIEEIIFVKQGVLSVELPINLTNPQENIDKYLSIPVLGKEKGNEDLHIRKMSKTKNDTLGSFLGESTPKKLYSFANSSTINSSMNYRTSFMGNSSLLKMKTKKEKKVYVKILGIRENEHFGDVLMFLEERSPLRLRVRSKKCELFFLKKIDALKISTAYSNIWRRINKKSVYNFKQIKKNIRKIVEIYCSVKKVNEKKTESSESNDEFLKKSDMWVRPKNFDLNNSALNSTKKHLIELRSKSVDGLRIRYKKFFLNKNGINDEYFEEYNTKNIFQKIKKCHSVKISNTNFNSLFYPESQTFVHHISFSDSSSSSILEQRKKKFVKRKDHNIRSKKKKLTKKLMDVFNRNYMYYKGINKKNEEDDYPITIIAEETDKECSLNPMLKSNNNSVYKNSINSKTKILDDEDTNPINRKRNKNHKKNKNKEKKPKQSLFGLTDIKINNYETVKNREILINTSEDNNSIEDENENIINNEIYPNELIEINNTENLLDKKINYNSQYDIENNYKINSNLENNRNKELEKLLKYFEEESKSIHIKETLKDSSYIKSSNKISRIANNSNKLIFHHENDSSSEQSKNAASSIHLNLKTNWDSNSFSIKNDISLTINSSYENYNIISGEKLIKSKSLQNKLKEYLINEVTNETSREIKNSNRIKKTNSLEQNLKSKEEKKKPILKNLSQHKRTTSSIVYNTTNINYINSVSFMKNKPKRLIKKSSSLMERVVDPIKIENNSDNASANFRTNNIKAVSQIKNDSKLIEGEFYGRSTKNTVKFNFNTRFGRKKQSEPLIKSSNNIKAFDPSYHKPFNIFDDNLTGRQFNYETTKEIPRRSKAKRHSVIVSSGLPKGKKKKDDLLSLIDYNIQRTNQKLNDPDGFYSNYFNKILKEEMKEKNKKKP